MATQFTKANFKELTEKGVALIDFWAPWCGPCRMLGPVIDELATEMEGRAVVGKANCDEEPELAQQFNIRSIPALFVLKDGKVVNQFVGVTPKTELSAALESALS